MVSAPSRASLPEYGDRAGAGLRAARPAVRRTEYPGRDPRLDRQLRQMPGVGPRSAERIALWIVQARQGQPEGIARRHHPDARRHSSLCPVRLLRHRRTLRDLRRRFARPRPPLRRRAGHRYPPLEKTSAFRGRYHSLGGRISPLDRVAPEDLRIDALLERVEKERLTRLSSPSRPTWKGRRRPIISSIC